MAKKIKTYALVVLLIVVILSTSGVFAIWKYANAPLPGGSSDVSLGLGEFVFVPELPEEEVSFLQRMYDILNQKYTTENIQDARKYLLEETILVQWDPGAPPYVGSMDKDYETQINELFGDLLDNYDVSFILKNEDLNWDGYNEIACYSTSDPLDCCEEGYNGIVAVYLSVFTPVVDEHKNIIGYEMVCDSIYGFCNEVHYNPENPDVSSFSTTDWRDNVVYWHHILDTQPMPDNAIGIDGVTLFKYHYDSYHYRKYLYDGYPWEGYTTVWIEGKTASQVLAGKIPWIG